MHPEPPAQKPRRERHLVRWIFIGILSILGWYGWKAYDFRQAVTEAEALGWRFDYEAFDTRIRKDWKNAFRKGTWADAHRWLLITKSDQLESHFDVVHRLEPNHLEIAHSLHHGDLSGLKSLSSLSSLWLMDCPNLTSIDALKDIKKLNHLLISSAPKLANIDPIKELKDLQALELVDCKALPNLDALRDLATLKTLIVTNCTRLKNVDGILGLEGLQKLDLYANGWLTKETLTIVRSALPRTKINASYPRHWTQDE